MPLSIDPEGAIAGRYTDATNVSHGFVRITRGNLTSFDPEGSTSTYPSAINPDGVITAVAINPDGSITGYFFDSVKLPHGFVRSAKGIFTTFDPSGSEATYPTSIRPEGVVTGILY